MPSAPPATSRQRPEEILAQTLSAAPHPEATEGWSERGRRIFLIAMAAAGVVLVVAGLLVTKQLAPGPGNPTPLESGPGNGLASQLLHNEQPAPPAPSTINIPLPTTPTTRPQKEASQAAKLLPAPANTAPSQQTQSTAPTPTTAPPPPRSPSTTLPCGLLGQSLQQAQILPCGAAT
ncbi:MAG TPA: hypothetical protein VG076_10415, partial [Acidimicrobiales bacterium]|nr:hypothetical protein [Acidimicrobiales bacterium]